jgi:4-nitrophenyl phosphatase
LDRSSGIGISYEEIEMNGMLERLKPQIHGLILDMDGVLWKDSSPIGDLHQIFDRIRERDLQVVLATNNATRTIDEYLNKLNGFGVSLEPWQIVTSAEVVVKVLADAFPQKGSVFVVGENGMISALCEKGFNPITDPDDETPVVAVVGGFDRSLTYQKLNRASSLIRSGAAFYGTNPDATFPTPKGLIPGAGSIIAAIETAAGVKPIVIGKPASFMFELPAVRMRLSKEEILVVGDRLETDIAGGQGAGNRTALVLSGVSTHQQAMQWTPPPDLIARDLTELIS